MTRKVFEAVDKAREFFEIKGYPGDFFSRIEEVDYTDKYKLLLFKEDIDKLSGFIGYGGNGMAVICVNYKRSQGHQNFTLAHEVGHWFLHEGKSISDDDSVLGYSSDSVEQEANEFAGELLYPEKYLVRDYCVAMQQDVFIAANRAQFGKYVNELCHKYCLSFEMVLRRLLYKDGKVQQYGKVRKEIEKALGGKVAESFDRDFYVPNEELPQYQRFTKEILWLDE